MTSIHSQTLSVKRIRTPRQKIAKAMMDPLLAPLLSVPLKPGMFLSIWMGVAVRMGKVVQTDSQLQQLVSSKSWRWT